MVVVPGDRTYLPPLKAAARGASSQPESPWQAATEANTRVKHSEEGEERVSNETGNACNEGEMRNSPDREFKAVAIKRLTRHQTGHKRMSAMRTPTERQELHWCTKQKSRSRSAR